MRFDHRLEDWSDLSESKWPTLLIGNGLSINLWDKFQYDSLFDAVDLSQPSAAIFEALGTSNFEVAMESIHHARVVAEALESPTTELDRIHDEIRDSLFQAIAGVHVSWIDFPGPTHALIADTMDAHSSVYTTSYDLCLYWSHLENESRVDLVDYFWGGGGTFHKSDTHIRNSTSTPVHYLHGAVHLWQDDAGANGKWRNKDAGNLLNLATNYPASESRRPLFVSEGTSAAKLRTIQRSQYLDFCLDSLRADESDTIVFGHSLSAQDSHIAEALAAGAPRNVAVALYPRDEPQTVINDKIRISGSLSRHTVTFFDSTTHPLGARTLRIPDPWPEF